VEDDPPVRLEGLRETEEGVAALTVKVAVLVVPLSTAEIVTEVLADTGVVVIVNVAVVAPAATVTLAGTVADALLLDKLTAAPPVGAALLSVTVPVDEVPPVTVVGLKLTDDSVTAGGLMVSVAFCCVPPL
jgi:hypothetical protein